MKTRLQLQGELQKADSNAPKVYKNVLDVFRKTWRMEGIKGLQRGLLPAVCHLPSSLHSIHMLGPAYVQYGYQILLNGSRLGFYEPIRRSLTSAIGRNPNEVLVSTAVVAGAMTGCIGGKANHLPIPVGITLELTRPIAALGSPLFMVKARIQAYSPAFPVGAQHYYKGSFDALRTILNSDGVLGLWRGVNAAILRTAMVSLDSPFENWVKPILIMYQGSSVQLPSYNLGKSYLISWGWKENAYSTYLVASGVSGLCVCAAMQ